MQRDVSCIDCNDNESPINRGYSGSFIDIERTKLFSNFYSILNFVRENEQVCFEYIKKKKKKKKMIEIITSIHVELIWISKNIRSIRSTLCVWLKDKITVKAGYGFP